MNKLYYDKKREKRQSKNQLSRRGLFRGNIDLEALGIVELIVEHEIDIDLYTPIDTGDTEILEDGNAYVVYEKKKMVSDHETGFDVRLVMKDKVHSRRDSILVSGINFSFEGETHVLQTRSAGELLAWDKTRDKARTLPADTPIKVRTEADKTMFIPAGKLVTLLDHMEDYRMEVMDDSWTIKDSIDNAATDLDAFPAYETGIMTGWPNSDPIEL